MGVGKCEKDFLGGGKNFSEIGGVEPAEQKNAAGWRPAALRLVHEPRQVHRRRF